jgi:hypothetical protein
VPAMTPSKAQLLGSEAFELSLVGERVLVGSYRTYVAYISYSRYALGQCVTWHHPTLISACQPDLRLLLYSQ